MGGLDLRLGGIQEEIEVASLVRLCHPFAIESQISALIL